MSIVTLLTDFGLEDAWVGIMKGVILGINPDARLIDITHRIHPQDTATAAWTIAAAFPYFPPGTVHVIVVDPGVGSARDIICTRLNEHIFVAPDNGVLSVVLNSGSNAADIRVVDNPDFCLDVISNTFHGRDILAPVGAHLSLAPDLAAVGPATELENLVRLDLPQPDMTTAGELLGSVIMVDHFGNLITNIDRSTLEAFLEANGDRQPEISIGSDTICGLSTAYSQAGSGQPLAIFGSMGFLEIAIFGRNARREMGVSRGERVRISSPGSEATGAAGI